MSGRPSRLALRICVHADPSPSGLPLLVRLKRNADSVAARRCARAAIYPLCKNSGWFCRQINALYPFTAFPFFQEKPYSVCSSKVVSVPGLSLNLGALFVRWRGRRARVRPINRTGAYCASSGHAVNANTVATGS